MARGDEFSFDSQSETRRTTRKLGFTGLAIFAVLALASWTLYTPPRLPAPSRHVAPNHNNDPPEPVIMSKVSLSSGFLSLSSAPALPTARTQLSLFGTRFVIRD